MEIYDLLVSGVTGEKVTAQLRTARANLEHHRQQLEELNDEYRAVAGEIPLRTYNTFSQGAHVVGGRAKHSVDLMDQLDREYGQNRGVIEAWIKEESNKEFKWLTLSEVRTPEQIQKKRQSLESLLANDLAKRSAAGAISSACGERLTRAASATAR
ncbi:MAG TPA: hypothetical protein VM901_11255 [Bdellovibrionota bacterium]|nr:hypothetical protein [Bdellovibrionota bacterium]